MKISGSSTGVDIWQDGPNSYGRLRSFTTLIDSDFVNKQISEISIYPAVDSLDSTSRMLSPDNLVYNTTRGVQKGLQDIIVILGMDGLRQYI
ncbi:hypothetical protein L1987_22375 [Smallanthus sonchifolius]|uniref:Uncharacterized protein n=1 Tax=Smallanthus sonchifolius TaxID=185202 RepID=A0ACB9IDY6_9ASTR|nr:hypothetical protein L1987_22375 [Smallanthus sonchifolius]